MTGESAERAALGAGAIVMDVIASNDGRLPHEKIERIRQLRPDMILLSGGIDGGTTQHVVELAEIIAAADPKAAPRRRLRAAGHLRRQQGRRAADRGAPGGQDRPRDHRQPPADARAREPGPGARQDPRPVHGARHGAGAGLQEADGLDRRSRSCRRPAAVGSIIQTIAKRGEDRRGRRRHRRRHDRRLLRLPGRLQPHGVRQPRHELLASPTCWPRPGSPTSCAGCRSVWTRPSCATGSRTR